MAEKKDQPVSLDFIKKAFLFAVGIVAVAYEEIEKAVNEAVQAVEERTDRANSH